ncbi:MAG: precorrin-4 C(11)-methyltransferase [Treponema sp.]|nr:precorrin-4 C(11)-methyltransferase [Treponema sp.]
MIYFVGAGSGASDLITVRGARLLSEADVVVWAGSLVNRELLSYCKKTCALYDSATMTLEETDCVLKEAHRAGKCCVRLHTGDPAIFGAIREQMELLDAEKIPYQVVPGVSSMFAASAALKRELTVPEVSQTVIISRMEGRTPVPERERIASLSSHGATMVLFLSSGMISQLCKELLSGGAYREETPCAVVYKASWQDEKIVRGTLGDIAEKASKAGITKTALVLVGDFLGERRAVSRLYDKHFSTGYRTGSDGPAELPAGKSRELLAGAGAGEEHSAGAGEEHSAGAGDGLLLARPQKDALAEIFNSFSIVSFSERGKALSQRIASLASLPPEETECFSCFGENHESLGSWCARVFSRPLDSKKALVIFVGAAGIAVRSIAPYLTRKDTDPAVLVIDEGGRFVIPIAGGHIGGANEAARVLSGLLGAVPVITTASDVRGLWAYDSWASRHNKPVPDLPRAKVIARAVLAGKKVLSLGVGCKRGTKREVLQSFVEKVFSEYELPLSLVGAVSSIDLKKDEEALLVLSDSLSCRFCTYSAAELNAVQAGNASFSESAFVEETTGTGCVCERAACAAAGVSADWLLVPKTSGNGCTVSVAVSSTLMP